jgi:hypothetical protein
MPSLIWIIAPSSWLEAYLESNNILDKEQEGFRHFRSTTNALLTFVQSIFNGINQKESTVAVLIDLEKALDLFVFMFQEMLVLFLWSK